MHLATADSLISGLLLRDIAFILLGALAVGLVCHATRRLFLRPKHHPSADDSDGLNDFRSPHTPRKGGIDASHFTGWDFLICGLVLSVFLLPVFFIVDPNGVSEPAVNTVVESLEPEIDVVPETTSKVFEFIVSVGVYSLLASLVIIMIQWVGMRSPWKVFGLGSIRVHHALIFILIGASLAILSINFINAFSLDFIDSLFGEVEVQAPVKELQESSDPFDRILLMLSAVIVAPLFEELVFRGYFYGVLKKFTEPMFAAFISGGIFAIIHQNIPAVLPLWFFGIFLALAYEASRSLWVPIGIHAAFNCTTVIAIFYQTGQTGEETIAITSLLP